MVGVGWGIRLGVPSWVAVVLCPLHLNRHLNDAASCECVRVCYMCVCACVLVGMCMCVCLCVCASGYLCVRVFYMCVYVRIYSCDKRTLGDVVILEHALAQTGLSINTWKSIVALTHTYKHTHSLSLSLSLSLSHTHTHTHAHTHTQTLTHHTHTHAHGLTMSPLSAPSPHPLAPFAPLSFSHPLTCTPPSCPSCLQTL